MTGFDDEELIAQLPTLRKIACSWRNTDPEDLVQSTCERALAKRHLFRGGDLQPWLVRVMQRIRIDEIRNRPNETASPYSSGTTPATQDTTIMVREVVATIDRMTECGAPLILSTALGYTYRELAEQNNVLVGTVMSRLFRARKTLHAECER